MKKPSKSKAGNNAESEYLVLLPIIGLYTAKVQKSMPFVYFFDKGGSGRKTPDGDVRC